MEYAQQALTLSPHVPHDLVMLTLDSAVAATYAEADEFIKGARTHAKVSRTSWAASLIP